MLHKTRGIVIKHFKYRDTSIIVKIFTEAFGLQTYIVNGVRSAKAKSKIALYQPLTLLDMVVYHKPSSEINRISEIKCTTPLATIPYKITKSAIAVFIAELLYKTIKEEGEVRHLYYFVEEAIVTFDHLSSHYLNFHLQFLLKLTHHLGFGLETAEQLFLDYSNPELILVVSQLLNEGFDNKVQLNSKDRRALLDTILMFYHNHIDNLGEIKSIKVLRETLE